MAATDAASRLEHIASLVQRGEFEEAEYVGNTAGHLPLAVPRASLRYGAPLSEGTQATVFRGHWVEREIAIKKAVIREAVDLVRFRREVELLASCRHPNIVALLAARMLPPNYLSIMEIYTTSAGHAIHRGRWQVYPWFSRLLNTTNSVSTSHPHHHPITPSPHHSRTFPKSY